MWNKLFPTHTQGHEETPRFEGPPRSNLFSRGKPNPDGVGGANKYRVPEPLDYSSASIRPGSPLNSTTTNNNNNNTALRPRTAVGGGIPLPNNNDSNLKHRNYVPLGHIDEQDSSYQQHGRHNGFNRLEVALRRAIDRLGPGMELTEKWDQLALWVDKYFDHADTSRFKDVATTLWKHVQKETATRDCPNALRTATSFMLYEQLMHVVGSTHPELRGPAQFLRNEMLQCIYLAPNLAEIERGFFVLDDPRDALAQSELINRFYGRTYFHSVRETAKAQGLHPTSIEAAERKKERFIAMLGRLSHYYKMVIRKLCIRYMRLSATTSKQHHVSQAQIEKLQKDLLEKEQAMKSAKAVSDKAMMSLNKELQELRQGVLDRDRIMSVEAENNSLKKELEAMKKVEDEKNAPLHAYVKQLEDKLAEFRAEIDSVRHKLVMYDELVETTNRVGLEMTELQQRLDAAGQSKKQADAAIQSVANQYGTWNDFQENEACGDPQDIVTWLNTIVGKVLDGRYAVVMDLDTGSRLLDPYLCVLHELGMLTEDEMTSLLKCHDNSKKAHHIAASLVTQTHFASCRAKLEEKLVSNDKIFHGVIVSFLHDLYCEEKQKQSGKKGKEVTIHMLISTLQNAALWRQASVKLLREVLTSIVIV